MKLRLTLVRPQGSTDDIVVTADGTASIGEVAATVVRADPLHQHPVDAADSVTIEAFSSIQAAGGEVLDPASTLTHVGLASGATVRVVPASYDARPVLGRMLIESGFDAGRSIPLTSGAFTIGRDASCDIVLNDPLVSKRHARLEVAPDRVELIDLNSANGIVVDGSTVARLAGADGHLDATLGDSRLVVALEAGGALETGSAARAAASVRQIDFVRSPRVEQRYAGEELPGTDLPTPIKRTPFPWLALVAPLVMGVVMFAVLRNITSVLFVALAPLIMAGTWITAKLNAKRESRDEKERFEQQIERLGERLGSERDREIEVRRREVPELGEISADALAAGPLVWTRRREHWSFLHLRLGAGETTSRNTVRESSNRDRAIPEFVTRLDELVDAHRTVPDVPILEALPDAGAVGVSGDPAQVAAYARALMAQVAGLHAPGDVVIAGLWGPRWGRELQAAKWLPHAWAAETVLGTSAIADNPASAARLVAQLEELIEARTPRGGDVAQLGALSTEAAATASGGKVGEKQDSGKAGPHPAVIVFIAADAPADLGRLIQISERAATRGIHPIWLTDAAHAVPASCRTFVEFGDDGVARARFVRLGQSVEALRTEQLTAEQFQVFARALARLTDAGEVERDQSDVPRTVPLLHLLGRDMATQSESIVDRWKQNDSLHSSRVEGSARRYQPKLRALVGQGAQGAMTLDLRQQGPHALVGGTTGSGKSEFLQAWVLGMAAEYSPDRCTFLFVDYKGGSAFADCIKLPHCVGLVTDLNPHLVRRVLVSLRAELHHREHLFNRKKAKDILELERAGDPQAPPALVLVIDEFAALAKEVPEFVDGVVDIAQRGRSLGIHLIMATQRPAGVIKDNLRANTNLRVALRMADETDSDDVIGSKDAALFDPGLPGRGIAKTGPGRMTLFQSAYAGGWSLREADEASIDIEAFGVTEALPWVLPVDESAAAETEEDLGPNDQQLLVARMGEAALAAGVNPPRRPWLDELAPTFDQTKLPQRTDAALLVGVVDVPEHQQQTPFHFTPDDEGHIAIFGTGGSGKSVALRTLAVSAGITPRGGPVHVYGVDFSSGGLKMLEALPHVGSVIPGDDTERVERLFAMLRSELDRRGDAYSEAGASTLTEYRSLAGKPDEPRILVLIDGYPTFRSDYEGITGRADTYRALQQVLSDGRGVGIHVALTADRAASVPSALHAMIQRRIVLRMTDADAYSQLDVPRDILSAASPPGRAIVGGLEAQIAVIGGTRSTKEQSLAIERMAASMTRRGFAPAPAVRSLPTRFTAAELPDRLGDQIAVGISDSDLGPFGIEPFGTFLIAGPPASGRSNALAAVAAQAVRARPETHSLYLGNPRSPAATAVAWSATASDSSSGTAALAAALELMDAGGVPIVAIEGISEFATSMLEIKLSELVRRAARGEALLIAEGETSSWSTNFGLIGEIKSPRRGVILQPETIDGEIVLKSPFPRLARGEFPVGRGILAQRGKLARVHFPLLVEERS